MQRSKRSLDATKWNRGSPHHTHDRVGDSLDGRSKRSLDATKWNRGSPHHTHDRVGGSLDGGRRWVMVASVASMQRSGIEGPCITPTTASAARSMAAASVASMQRSGIEGPRITPTTVSAVRSMAVGAWSWLRHRSRLAAAIAMRGLLSGWVSCVSPLTLQRYAFKPPSEFHLAFGVCRLDEWSTSRARNF